VPRTRASNPRLAVLGSSVQRPAPAPLASRSRNALTRRIVLGVLVVLSLALITIYYRETSGGFVHRTQGAGASVLRPFEVGANRVARPFEDVYGYFHGLATARSENKRLKADVEKYRQLWAQSASALQKNVELEQALGYHDMAKYPEGYRPVFASVVAQPPSQFEQSIVVAAGSNAGVRAHDPVVSAGSLVGEVTKVFPSMSRVTMLTDAEIAVAAKDVTGPSGLIRHGQGSGDALILDHVTKDQIVHKGDMVVTSGILAGRLRSLYPKNIPIGIVTSVGQSEVELYKLIQVSPFVDFSTLDTVAVLVSKKPPPQLP
jgi:rod shape-determining protein MreC